MLSNFNKAFPEEIYSKMPYFPLDGKKIFNEMKWIDRTIMRFVIRITEKKKPFIAQKMREEFDRVNKDEIQPIVKYMKNNEL